VAAVLIRNAEIWGHGLADLRIEHGRIAGIEPASSSRGAAAIDARGGALLPGLHDHHIHLAALAAKRTSVWCGPPEITTPDALVAALALPGDGWIRGIGYHDSVMGLPTARELDALASDRPLRIQHRSGRMWLLNSLAIEILLQRSPPPPGMEIMAGRFTGRLFDEDDWLRTTLTSAPPAFADLGRELASYGITGITDMSPRNDPAMAAHFTAEMAGRSLPQRVVLAGSLALAEAPPGPWMLGPAKLHLHESALPDFDAATAFIIAAHHQDRVVAVHCVSEVELVFALAAFESAGVRQGDRIEHASVASDELVERIAALALQVCVQPHFIAERGDDYLRDVEPRHHRELYRLASFRNAGVTLAGGSDAPYGLPDPWLTMGTAISRRTRAGVPIETGEALSPEEALGLYLADPQDLARLRNIALGAAADLCLLNRPWAEARDRLSTDLVRATWISGRLIQDGIDQAPA
jgi:predicted amidohydrolase YtcJ